MDNLFIILLLVALGFLVYSLYRLIRYRNKTELKKLGFSFLGVIVAFIGVGIFMEEPETDAEPEQIVEETETIEEEPEVEEEQESEPETEEPEEVDAEDLADDTEDVEEIDWEEARAIDQENIDWRTDVTWDNLARNHEDYMFEHIQIEGEVQTTHDDDGFIHVQLMMDGDVDKPVIVSVEEEYLESRILNGDWLTIQGNIFGLTEYETVLGATVTAPHFYGDFVTIN